MRAVVTGGSGFLGSHVADALAAAGHDVTVFDLAPSVRHRSVTGDLLDAEALREALRGAEAVCHLGAIGDVYLAGDRPALAAAVNVTGTANVCDAALACDVGRCVVASTWEVYGQPRYEPLDEEHPCEPNHPYSVTKLAGERLALAYAHLRGLDVVALRLGTAYGTRMRPNSVFSIFIRRALAAEPITIQGSGRQGRQFTHVGDLARAFGAALTRGRSGAAYNVVADPMVTIRELAEMVVELAPTELTYGAPRPGDVPSARVSSALAERELGWSARVAFADGLGELVDEARAAPVD
ncbi:MAG: NAD-dependent epimerase/dehydratase family protein [Candidatus Limnocylindria bacterium]